MSVQMHPKDLFTVPDSIKSIMMNPGGSARPKSKDKSQRQKAGRPFRSQTSSLTSDRNSTTPSARNPSDVGSHSAAASAPGNFRTSSQNSTTVAKSRAHSSAAPSFRGGSSRPNGQSPGSAGSRGQSSGKGYRTGASSRSQGSARQKQHQHRDEDEFRDYDEFAEQDIQFINIPSSRESDEQLGIEFVQTPRETSAINPQDILHRSQETNRERVYEINLSSSEISQITNLESFCKLRVLDLSCNYIKVIDNLHYCTELRELKLYDNHIWEIGNLDKLKDLCHLQLQHNRIKSLGKGLQNCRRLKQLRVDNNYISRLDVRELAGCAALTHLDLSSNRLDNIGAVSCLPNLEELSVRNNRLRGISDLSRCRKLQEVDFSYNRLSDVAGLKGLPNLTVLHLAHNQLTSLKSIGKLKLLQEIYISHNRLVELQSLCELYPALQILDVADNCVETWQQMYSLKDLPELVELYVTGNPFCSEHGPKPSYHRELHELIPHLEVLDGAHLRRPSSRASTPLMRPMSANSVVSARQVETQLRMMEDELSSFENSLAAKFESLRTSMNELPVQPAQKANSATPDHLRPKSRCGKRSRIQLAMEYAESQNFDG